MGWEIPEQETARRQDWLGWVLGRKGGMMTCTRHTHIYLMPTKGDTSEFLSYIRTHVREMDAVYIILNNEYTRDLLVAVQPRSLIVTCEGGPSSEKKARTRWARILDLIAFL